jgi:hypothetical protein
MYQIAVLFGVLTLVAPGHLFKLFVARKKMGNLSYFDRHLRLIFSAENGVLCVLLDIVCFKIITL